MTVSQSEAGDAMLLQVRNRHAERGPGYPGAGGPEAEHWQMPRTQARSYRVRLRPHRDAARRRPTAGRFMSGALTISVRTRRSIRPNYVHLGGEPRSKLRSRLGS